MGKDPAEGRISELRAMDVGLLQEVVRQDQNCAEFEITGWSVDRLNEQGFAN